MEQLEGRLLNAIDLSHLPSTLITVDGGGPDAYLAVDGDFATAAIQSFNSSGGGGNFTTVVTQVFGQPVNVDDVELRYAATASTSGKTDRQRHLWGQMEVQVAGVDGWQLVPGSERGAGGGGDGSDQIDTGHLVLHADLVAVKALRLTVHVDAFANSGPGEGHSSGSVAVVDCVAYGDLSGGQIRGTVYDDSDANGSRSTGEAGLAEWQVFLDDDRDGVLDSGEQSATADADGSYSLTGVPVGEHLLREIQQTGWEVTTPLEGKTLVTFDTAPRPAPVTVDFGNHRLPVTSTLVGAVYDDANRNGQRDPAEWGISQAFVFVDENSNQRYDAGELNAVTNAAGDYSISGITPGTHNIGHVAARGFVAQQRASVPANFSAGHTTRLDFADVKGTNFGNVRAATISGAVWEDLDGDGTRQTSEPWLPDTVVFVDANGNGALDAGERATTSDPDGRYAFESLLPGSYSVQTVVAPNWYATHPSGGVHHVQLAVGQTLADVDFGLAREAEIRGVVFHDSDADGIRDSSEGGQPDVVVFVDLNDNGQFDADEPQNVTAADGTFLLDHLRLGTLTVREIVPANMTQTFPLAGAGHIVTLTSGQAVSGLEFGVTFNCFLEGWKWEDLNLNGRFDDAERGLGGITIYVDLDRDGQRDTGEPFAVTESTAPGVIPDRTGHYLINDLPPGQYQVREEVPAGWIAVFPTGGVQTIDLASCCAGLANPDDDHDSAERTAGEADAPPSIQDSVPAGLAAPSNHNASNPLDVTGDGDVAEDDAREVLALLEAPVPVGVASQRTRGPFADVNNDHFVTALDSLLVINVLYFTPSRGANGAQALALLAPPYSVTALVSSTVLPTSEDAIAPQTSLRDLLFATQPELANESNSDGVDKLARAITQRRASDRPVDEFFEHFGGDLLSNILA